MKANKGKHIVIDGRMLSWPGVGRHTRALVTHLQTLDSINHYTIIVLSVDTEKLIITKQNFKLKVVKQRPYSWGEQLSLWIELYRLKADTVHFLAPNQPLLYFKPAITTINDLTLLKFPTTRHSKFAYWLKQRAFRLVLWKALHFSSVLTSISQSVKTELLTYYPKLESSKVKPILLGPTQLKTRPSPYQPTRLARGRYILFVGYAFPHKNISRLIQAFLSLKPKYPKLKLVLVGKMNFFYHQLQEAATKLKWKNDIIFTNYISDGQLRWLYQNTLTVVSPSLTEGFGLPLLEAMEQEAPLVVSRIPIFEEIAGSAALYFDPRSVSEMAKQIESIMNPEQAKTLQRYARQQLLKFNWQKTAAETLKLYKQY